MKQTRRLRLAVVGPSPCGQCVAACCKKSVSEFAVLLQGDAERRRFAAWSLTLPVNAGGRVVHERVIPYRNDTAACPFLGDDDRCTIYQDRPRACREFECTRGFNQDGVGKHGFFLRGNPHVVRMLETMGRAGLEPATSSL